jgi:hypothetical protein
VSMIILRGAMVAVIVQVWCQIRDNQKAAI